MREKEREKERRKRKRKSEREVYSGEARRWLEVAMRERRGEGDTRRVNEMEGRRGGREELSERVGGES